MSAVVLHSIALRATLLFEGIIPTFASDHSRLSCRFTWIYTFFFLLSWKGKPYIRGSLVTDDTLKGQIAKIESRRARN